MDEAKTTEWMTAGSNGSRGGYAEWIALGALVAGSVGAIVGVRRHVRHAGRKQETGAAARLDPATLTAPHGDKLSQLL